jgi:putative hemolysin
VSNSIWEILIIFLLLVANGVFAMAEIAIVSARKARLQQLANAGDSHARTALELAANPNQFLATVQIGITLVGILAGAFGGATIAEEIAALLNGIPYIAPHGEPIGVCVVVLGITYFSLIIGELVPKRLALNNAERIAAAVAAPMRALSTVATPVVRMLSSSTDIVIRLLGVKPSTEPSISPEEIRVLIGQGTESGVFEESEQDMIENVLRLDERRVGTVMTPRTQIVGLKIDDSPEDIRRKIATSQYSRFPVIKDTLDNVLGIVRVKDLLDHSLGGQSLDLKALLQPPLYITESMSILKVLELFKEKGTHIALIMDEYGGLEGMVTHNDILEDIVGYIPSADEPEEPEVTRREDGSWLLDGLVPIDKLKEIFNIEKLPNEKDSLCHTVGGFVMAQFGTIPCVGQHFQWEKMRFEVVDMDGRRVDKVLITHCRTKGGHNV